MTSSGGDVYESVVRANRYANRYTHTHRQTCADTHRHTHPLNHTDRQTDRQASRYRKKDRWIGRTKQIWLREENRQKDINTARLARMPTQRQASSHKVSKRTGKWTGNTNTWK